MPSFNYIVWVVTEVLLILCFYVNYNQNLWRHQLSNLHNTKSWISLETEKISEYGKHLSSFWEAFRMSWTCFSFQGTLIKVRLHCSAWHGVALFSLAWLPVVCKKRSQKNHVQMVSKWRMTASAGEWWQVMVSDGEWCLITANATSDDNNYWWLVMVNDGKW